MTDFRCEGFAPHDVISVIYYALIATVRAYVLKRFVVSLYFFRRCLLLARSPSRRCITDTNS